MEDDDNLYWMDERAATTTTASGIGRLAVLCWLRPNL